MSPIATHPLSRLTTGTISPDGVDLVIYSAGVDLPETGHCSYDVALHQDGAPCSPECGCVDAENRTTIWEGTTITRGEWTWHADRYVLVGLRSTGPSRPELRARVDELDERIQSLLDDLEAERGNHQVTRLDLAHNIRSVRRLDADLGESTALLVQLREGRDAIAAERDRGRQWILGLLVVNVVLAAALVWAVIA